MPASEAHAEFTEMHLGKREGGEKRHAHGPRSCEDFGGEGQEGKVGFTCHHGGGLHMRGERQGAAGGRAENGGCG